MQTENNLSLQIKHYVDSDFNEESSFRYQYFLILAQNEILSIVADEQLNRIVSFKSFSNNAASFLDMNYDQLKLFTEITDQFTPNYKSKRVIIADDNAILVPDSLNNIVESEAYYQLNRRIKLNSQVLYNKLNILNTVSLFNIRNEILKFIRFNIPTADIMHQSLLFIKACSLLDEPVTENTLCINIHNEFIEILQLGDNQINYYNNFRFDSQTDITYYILAVAEQLNISKNLHLVIFGAIEVNDSQYLMLKKYCTKIALGKRLSKFTFPADFSNMPAHFYFTASSVLLCE